MFRMAYLLGDAYVRSSRMINICVRVHTRVKKDLMSPPRISTLGLRVTQEGKSSWPLKTWRLELKVTAIVTLGANESITSPITLPTTSGSEDDMIFAISVTSKHED